MKPLFVIVWLGLLGAPLLQTLYPLVPERPVLENRVLARRPALSWQSLAHASDTLKSFFDWFNDNHGLRTTLIRLRTSMDYRLRYSGRVHLGPDGWLYYRDVLDGQKVANERLPPAAIDAVRDRLLRLRRFLADRGIRLLVVSVPQKDAIYPECVGADAPTFRRPTAFERLRGSLTQAFGADHIDAQLILTAATHRGIQAFHRTDFHWTDVGGGEVARAIVNRIADSEGTPALRWTEPLPVEPLVWAGGESQQLPMFEYVYEHSVKVRLDWQDSQLGSFEWHGVDAHFDPERPLGYSFTWSSRPGRALLPAVTVVSNSYGESFWRSGLHYHFSKVYGFRFAPSRDGAFLASVLATMGQDSRYFVLQFHEAELAEAGVVKWSDLGL